MFLGDRWADAFMAAAADHAGEGLDALKAIVPPISRLPGHISGSGDAGRLEKLLRSVAPGDTRAEYAIPFVALLVRKGYFTQLAAALQALEQRIDAENGVLTVHVESAQPLDDDLDDDLQEKIRAGLRQRTGAREIRLVSRLVPELLGGYRLRIGTEMVDTSLQGQLQRMAVEVLV